VKGEMWAHYHEIKYRREDDRSHPAPGETLTTAGRKPDDASSKKANLTPRRKLLTRKELP
jgi:hypothetical protein